MSFDSVGQTKIMDRSFELWQTELLVVPGTMTVGRFYVHNYDSSCEHRVVQVDARWLHLTYEY